VAGLDEAGRGPVIGSMFIALVAMEKSQVEKLVLLGLKDSKSLTPARRRYFYNLILKTAKLIMIKEVRPEEIDKESVSALTIKAMRELIEEALKKQKIDEIYVDVVGHGKQQEEELKKVFENVKVLTKGDERCPIVAAASVVAKEVRERHVRNLKKEYGDFGSGYPSDPKTKRWLEGLEGHPPIVRKKWRSVRRKRSGKGGGRGRAE